MLSVSGGMAAESASSYFSKEDYYLVGSVVAEWLGKGAEAIGLTGAVQMDDFKAIAKGIHPQTGEQLVVAKITKDMHTGMQIETRRAGNDLTFSAPKSVSVAYAADATGIKEAHDFAVKSVCTHIEQHYCQARTPEGFENGSLFAPKFDHATSRTLDPQLHSHLFICNVTQTQDGQFRANEPLNIFKDQKKLGELYRQELASQLRQQGYEINFTDRTLSIFEIREIAPDLIDQFSKRRAAIEKQVEVWKSNGEYKGVSEPKLCEMAALKTRQAKDRSLTREDVVKAWDQGFKEAGTTREAVKEQLEVRRQQVLFERQHLPAEPDKSSNEVIQQAAALLRIKRPS